MGVFWGWGWKNGSGEKYTFSDDFEVVKNYVSLSTPFISKINKKQDKFTINQDQFEWKNNELNLKDQSTPTPQWNDLGWFNLTQQSTMIYGIDGIFSSYNNKEFLIILPLRNQGRTQFYIPQLSQSGILSTSAISLSVSNITRFIIGTITRGVVENFDLSLIMDGNPNETLSQVRIYWR